MASKGGQRPRYVCPCCGYSGLQMSPYRRAFMPSQARGLSPPYSQYFGDPSYDVCDCCGFEFGADDEAPHGKGYSFEEYLEEWVRSGCEWFDPATKPEGWQLEAQLDSAGLTA